MVIVWLLWWYGALHLVVILFALLLRLFYNGSRNYHWSGHSMRYVDEWDYEYSAPLGLAPAVAIFATREFGWGGRGYGVMYLAIVSLVVTAACRNWLRYRGLNRKAFVRFAMVIPASWLLWGFVGYAFSWPLDALGRQRAAEHQLATVESDCEQAIRECGRMSGLNGVISRKVLVYRSDADRFITPFSFSGVYGRPDDDSLTIVFVRQVGAELVGGYFKGGRRRSDAYRETVELLVVDWPEKSPRGRGTVVCSNTISASFREQPVGGSSPEIEKWIEGHSVLK